MAQKTSYIPFQKDHTEQDINCNCDTCKKARACKVTLVTEGRARIYDVTTSENHTYRTVVNTSLRISCNCKCGQHRTNSPCSHARATRWAERQTNLQVNLVPAGNYYDEAADVIQDNEYIF